MDDFLNSMNAYEIANKIYSHSLFEIDQIARLLGMDVGRYDFELKADIASSESLDDAVSRIAADEKSKFVYGEIKRESAEDLMKFIKNKIGEGDDVFCDIGSGHGKMLMHFSLISDFKELVGIEINEVRNAYAEMIKKDLQISERVRLICGDLRDEDLSRFDFVFMNDLLFSQEDIDYVVDGMRPGAHLISISKNRLDPQDQIYLRPTWQDAPLPFKYYRI